MSNTPKVTHTSEQQPTVRRLKNSNQKGRTTKLRTGGRDPRKAR